MIIYRMVIVEGRRTQLQLLISYIYNHWLTQKYSEFWLIRYNGFVWSNIAVPALLPSCIYNPWINHIHLKNMVLLLLFCATSLLVTSCQPWLSREERRWHQQDLTPMILPGCQTSDSASGSKFHHWPLLVALVLHSSNFYHWPLLVLLVVLVLQYGDSAAFQFLYPIVHSMIIDWTWLWLFTWIRSWYCDCSCQGWIVKYYC